MRRSRTLARVALTGLLCAGLTGCANRVGDLGAARDEETPVLRAGAPAGGAETQRQDAGPVAEVVNVDKGAPLGAAPRTAGGDAGAPHDPKDLPAELVSLQPAPLAEVPPVPVA
ncbi:MAG: hypothetical protein ABSE73_16135, partial [Planctomycetota bacterium]